MSNSNRNGESVIITQLNRLTRAIYGAFAKGIFGRSMSSYTSLDSTFRQSALVSSGGRTGDSHAHPLQKDGGIFSSLASSVKHKLLSADFSTYTVFSVFYLISVLIARILKMYNNGAFIIVDALKLTAIISVLIMAVVFCSFLATDKSLGRLLLESRLVQLVLNKILGIGEEYYYYYENRAEKHIPIAIILGILSGALAYLFSPVYMLLGVALLLLCAVITALPEVGVVLSILFMPVLSTLSHNGIAPYIPLALIELSYAYKVKQRKRHFSFHIADLFVALTAVAVLFGGFTSYVSLKVSLVEAVKNFVLILAYFPIRNMMRDKLWIKKFLNALFLSGFAIALLCLAQMIVGSISPITAAKLFGVEFSGYANVVFSNSTVLGIYLAITATVSLIAHENRGNKTSILFFGCIVLMSVGVLCTISFVAIAALAIGIAAFLIINSHKSLTALLLAALPLALVVTLIVSAFYQNGDTVQLMSERSEASLIFRLDTWNDVLIILKDNWFTGVGVGAFPAVFEDVSAHAAQNVTNTGSLYFDVWISIGIVGLLLLIAVMLLHMQRAFTFLKKSKNSAAARKLKGALSALITLFLLGFVKSLWADVSLEFVFWLTLSLVNAISDYGYNELRLQDSQSSATPYETVIRIYLDH